VSQVSNIFFDTFTKCFFVYTFIYPILRIILGREKCIKVCNFFIKIPIPPGVFSFPTLIKSKITLMDIEDWGVLIEMYIRDVYDKNSIRQGMNVVDIGAHIGAYTILAAEKIRETGKVIAVEPEPKNYQRLLENIKINDFKNVIPVKIALSDYNGQDKLYVSDSSIRNSLFKQHFESSIEVMVRTLDSLLEELHMQRVDVIKIDAEGAEMPILKGAEKTLKNNPHMKLHIASYHYPSELKEVQDFLHQMGFKTKVNPFDIVTTY